MIKEKASIKVKLKVDYIFFDIQFFIFFYVLSKTFITVRQEGLDVGSITTCRKCIKIDYPTGYVDQRKLKSNSRVCFKELELYGTIPCTGRPADDWSRYIDWFNFVVFTSDISTNLTSCRGRKSTEPDQTLDKYIYTDGQYGVLPD